MCMQLVHKRSTGSRILCEDNKAGGFMLHDLAATSFSNPPWRIRKAKPPDLLRKNTLNSFSLPPLNHASSYLAAPWQLCNLNYTLQTANPKQGQAGLQPITVKYVRP